MLKHIQPQLILTDLVTTSIGGGTPVTGTFSDIDWSTGIYFLKLKQIHLVEQIIQ